MLSWKQRMSPYIMSRFARLLLLAVEARLTKTQPHGVLYGMMYRDREICRAVYGGIPKGTPVFGLAGTFHEEVAKELGLPFVAELYGKKNAWFRSTRS